MTDKELLDKLQYFIEDEAKAEDEYKAFICELQAFMNKKESSCWTKQTWEAFGLLTQIQKDEERHFSDLHRVKYLTGLK